MKLKAMVDVLLKAVYPPRCVFCGEQLAIGEICCAACRRTERPCPITQRFHLPDGNLLRCYALYSYTDAARRAMHDLKFRDRKEVGAALGALMAEDTSLCRLVRSADCVTAVPISRRRMAVRGYNQSELIARELARQCGTIYEDVLEKHIHNAAQSTLGREERLENVDGVYRLRKTADLRGKSVVLADDIVTTGATLCACAAVLYQAGAARVLAVTFAHAELS